MADNVSTPPRAGFLRGLYDWVISHAAGPHALWALAAVAFAEASFFPIPPDIMLIPMMLADRRRAFLLAGWCTLFSVLGGLLGYTIGALLYDSVGHWLIDLYGDGGKIDAFRAAYAKWGGWLILFQGFTPVPYKIVTIATGFAGYSLPRFLLFSALTRGTRFTLEACLLYWLGEPVRGFIEKRLEIVTFLFFLLIVAGFVIVRYVI